MKYELIGKNNLFNPLEQVLINRGVENPTEYLKSFEDKSVVNHYSKLKNIDKAVGCLLKHLDRNNKIWIQVDSDFDGFSSSAALINYLKAIDYTNIEWRLHEGKEHGVKSKHVPDDVDLVIVPDAGSSDYNEHKKLYDRGKDVIILDHHETEKESGYAIVVNNQISPDYPNKNFSGVGVVYKFLEALDDVLNIELADNYLDLVAVGNIGDMMSLHEKETRYYITQGLKNIKNPMLKDVFLEQEFSTKGKQNPTTVSFYIAPLFNATIRSGEKEEKEQVFQSLLDDGSSEKFYERGKTYEPLTTNTIRLMKRVRVRQNKARDKGVAKIEKKIEEKNLLENKLLVVEIGDILEKNFTGLVANILQNKYKRPVLLLKHNVVDNMMSGSARGYEKGTIKDFKQYLNNTQMFEFAEGHSNAFGAGIYLDNLIKVVDYINEDLADIEIDESIYEVDFVIPSSSMRFDIIFELDKAMDVWGKDIEEPMLAIEKLEVERRNIKVIGKNENVIKFSSNGIEYIKFKADDEDKDNLINGKSDDLVELEVIGRASINEWRGNKTGQIIIEDYIVKDIKKQELIF